MTPQDRERFAASSVVLANGSRVLIRPLRTSDTQALGDFYASVPAQDYRFYHNGPLTREYAETMAATADRPDRVALVLVPAPGGRRRHIPDSIGGYAWYRLQDGAERSVLGICMGPRFQNLGAGTALMKRLLEIAHAVGPPVISLTVQKANPRAIRLYRRMGFEIVREQTRAASNWFPAEPEYYMERPT